MPKSRIIVLTLFSFCLGIIVGGYLFSRSQPRSFLALNECDRCLAYPDFLGLLASVGIQRFPALMPLKVYETDMTIAFKYPFPTKRLHYIIVPKKDIKNIGEASAENAKYLTDAFLVARWIIEKEKLSKYNLSTNGPGSQSVAYLHFHLIADTGKAGKRK